MNDWAWRIGNLAGAAQTAFVLQTGHPVFAVVFGILTVAWIAIVPTSAIPSRRADDAEGGSAGTEGSAVAKPDAQTPSSSRERK